MKIAKWLIDRLKERSTWVGIAAALTAAGVAIEPALSEAIITAGVALAGVAAVVTKDK